MTLRKNVLTFIGIILVMVSIILFARNDEMSRGASIRALPRPVALEPVLITSGGQNTDSYIVKDIMNTLMIDNYFIPMATTEHLEGTQSVILVVGYSEIGNRIKDNDFIDEKNRIQSFLDEVQDQDLFLITVYLRGGQMIDDESKELLELSAKYSDYLIAVNPNSTFEEIEKMVSPTTAITYVDEIAEVTEPIVSAFR